MGTGDSIGFAATSDHPQGCFRSSVNNRVYFNKGEGGHAEKSNNRADVIICQLINEYEGTWTALSDVSELKVTASSSHTEYTPDNLKNKKSKVPWHSEGNEGKNQWLMFEFPEPQRVDGFRMQAYYASKLVRSWMGSSFKDYRFEKSNDGKTWTTIKSGRGKDLNCCEWQEIRWIRSSPAKFFRLYMVNNWGNARWQTIYKLELSLEDCSKDISVTGRWVMREVAAAPGWAAKMGVSVTRSQTSSSKHTWNWSQEWSTSVESSIGGSLSVEKQKASKAE